MVLAAVLAAGCSEKDDPAPVPAGRTPVEFSSNISGYSSTRATATEWQEDAIGVFMFPTGQTLSAENVLESNKKYTTEYTGRFRPASVSETILLPEDGAAVDFIAYYPYNSSVTDFIYPVDLSNQTFIEEIDLLWSRDATNISTLTHSGAIDQTFSHRLSRVVLNVVSDEGKDLSTLTATVSGFPNSGLFNLATGEMTVEGASVNDFKANVSTVTGGKTVEFLVMPTTVADQSVTFEIGGQTFTWELPAGLVLENGEKNTWDITLRGVEDVEVSQSYGWVELPTMKDIEGTTVVHHWMPDVDGRNFSLLYDKNYKISYWVAYPLVSWHVGDATRTNDWKYDPQIPESDQMNCIRYSFVSANMDRGHQLPSHDRTYSSAGNRTTFYMTNITPQNSTLNQQAWEKLEEKVRTFSTQCDTLYVVTGAALPADVGTIEWIADRDGNLAAKPEYYYKALAKRTGDTFYTAAYVYDNVALGNNEVINNHRITVKELEQMTGFTFFPALDDEIKGTVVENQWQ